MRRKNDRGLLAFQRVQCADELQALAKDRGTGMPEPAAIEPGLRKKNEGLPRE